MTIKFKLNTQSRSVGRVKGWSSVCDLDNTLKSVVTYHPEQKTSLVEAIKVELAKALVKHQQDHDDLMSPRAKRSTRYGNIVAARFNRSMAKVSSLENALKTLEVV